MHVAFLCNEYPPAFHGGVGTATQSLARALVGRGHRVTVAGINRTTSESREDDAGVNVIRIPHHPAPKLSAFGNASRLSRALKEVHASHPVDLLEGPDGSLALFNTAEFPRVLRMHGGHHFFAKTLGERPALVRAFLEKRAVQRATDLVGVSRFVADQTRELLSLGDRPIDIIPNGVDVERFQPGNATRESGLIVFVGTVAEKKGIGQLIGAMHDIVQAVPDGHLEVYGRDWMSGGQSLTKTLRRNISSDLSAHIRFKGHVPNDVLPQVLRRAAVAAYPSHMEAMPMTWLEGLASGCAVVAGRPGPGPEVIDHGVTGLLCDPHDPSDIAEKIVSVLKDERMRASLGSNARKSVLKRFALGVVVDANLEFYERCVARFRNA